MPVFDRKLILIASVALILVSVGLVLMAQKPTEAPSLLKAPPVAITPTPRPSATPTPSPTPAVKIAESDGEYFILTGQSVLEIDADKKTVRTFPFASRSAQRLDTGMTLFSYDDRVFETDAEGQVTWLYRDEKMNATSAWRRNDGITIVSDANGRILKIAPDAQINREISLGSGSSPSSVFPLPGDDALVTDSAKNTVTWIELDPEGSLVWKYGQDGQIGFAFNTLNAPTFASDIFGQSALITDAGNNRVLEVPYSSKQYTWEVNNVPKPQSAFLIGRLRLTGSARGAELFYQNRSFDWNYDAVPVFRVFPVKNLPAPLASRNLQQAPSGFTGFITGFQKSILRFFQGD